MNNFGEFIKQLREEKGLSQLALSKKINTSSQNINRWERGEVLPSIDFCIKLANFFNCTLDYLLGLTDESEKVVRQENYNNGVSNMKISEKIKELREEKGLTQRELGKMIGGQQANIYNYEVGRTEPSIEILKQLADIFGVSVGYLVGAEDEDGRAIPTDLSQKDKDLLKAFHKLGPFEQETIMIQISALAEKVNV